MDTGDPYPDAVKQSAEYARNELEKGFANDPEEYYEEPTVWNGVTHDSKRTFSGLGVHIDRDRYSDTHGDEKWKVEVRMASHPSADPLLIEDGLTVSEMENIIRAFQYDLYWAEKHGDYEPCYDRKD